MIFGCDQPVPADWGGGARSPYVPEDYELSFADDFERLFLVETDISISSTAQPHGSAWDTHFVYWNVRYLDGNNDQAYKVGAAFKGGGRLSLAEQGIRLHEITAEGTLKLFAYPTPEEILSQVENKPYLGGMISGERGFSQRYGYWESRVRINSISTGHHWAFWLLPDDHSWPPEIDMLEVVGSNPDNSKDTNRFNFNSHSDRVSQGDMTHVSPPQGINGWYTLGFHWTETAMRWYLNGHEVRERPNFVTDKDLYFLISPEVGGNWPGKPDASTVWPTEVEVDYIRVYQKTR